MALKKISRIRCSLNVGIDAYIYNFSYSYIPQDGIKISLFFISPTGDYNIYLLNSATVASFIYMDDIPFKMYAVSWQLDSTTERKVLRVDFIDQTHLLKKKYIALTGQGCGTNVYQLGSPVESGTKTEWFNRAADSKARKIQDLTQFSDLEYKFSEFLDILRITGLVITIDAIYDPNITKGFTGSFKEVLDAWCHYFNISYFFDSFGILRITSRSNLAIVLPTVPADAISSIRSESILDTFTKTAYAYFRQEGGQFSIPSVPESPNINSGSKTQNDNSSIITYATLFPIGAEFNLIQQEVDLNQVAAAMYGARYWFLWNYVKGTAAQECGWKTISITDLPGNTDIYNTVVALLANNPNGGIATFDEDYFNERYQFYKQYGERIAGRYYLSSARDNIIDDQTFQWYDDETTQNFKLSDLSNPLSIEFYQEGVSSDNGYLAGTEINRYYNGIRATGNRLVFLDTTVVDLQTPFVLTANQTNLINQYFSALTQGSFGSSSLDYSELGSNTRYVVFLNQTIDFGQATAFSLPPITAGQLNLFKARFTSFALKGVKAYAMQSAMSQQNNFTIIKSSDDSFITNTGPVQSTPNSDLTLYYSKFEKCVSESSIGDAINHILVPQQVSVDIPVTYKIAKASKKIYNLQRDLTYVNKYINSNILKNLAASQLAPTKRLSFTLSYLSESISIANPINQGLVGISIDISSDGMNVTYSFDDSIGNPPISEAFIEKLERTMKNSWLRKYNPTQSIGG